MGRGKERALGKRSEAQERKEKFLLELPILKLKNFGNSGWEGPEGRDLEPGGGSSSRAPWPRNPETASLEFRKSEIRREKFLVIPY